MGIAILLVLAGCGQRPPWSTGTSPNDAARAKAQFKIATARYQINHSVPEARAGFLEAARTDATYAKPYYNLAVLAAGEGDWKEAARLLGEYRKRDETSDTSVKAQLLMDRYEKLAKQTAAAPAGGTPGNAQEEYQRMVEGAKTALLKRGNLRGAMSALNEAIKIDPARWEAPALKAAILTDAGWFKDAEALYKLALGSAPADKAGAVKAGLQEAVTGQECRALIAKGQQAVAAKHYETAFHAYEQAWKLSPQDDRIGVKAVRVAFLLKDSGPAKGALATLAQSPQPEVRAEAASLAEEWNQLDRIKGKLASTREAVAVSAKAARASERQAAVASAPEKAAPKPVSAPKPLHASTLNRLEDLERNYRGGFMSKATYEAQRKQILSDNY